MILAGDVGGTKSSFALYRTVAEGLSLVRAATYPSAGFAALEEAVETFLSGGERVKAACVGVAGRVSLGRCRLTNLSWVVDEESLKRVTGARRARLLNDLQAAAYAVPFLGPRDVETVKDGAPVAGGTIAVIAAGTGLGESFMVRDGGGYIPVASEGGHADFAPRDEREIRLFRTLAARYGRVSLERVLSGPGLHAVYRFLRESEGMAELPDVEAQLAAGDPPRVIVREGLGTGSAPCREALKMFVSMYGAAAGNLALRVTAAGGVYLGGGIAPAILPLLKGNDFQDAFLSKGRFREFLAEIPVRVILRPEAILLGAAHYAVA